MFFYNTHAHKYFQAQKSKFNENDNDPLRCDDCCDQNQLDTMYKTSFMDDAKFIELAFQVDDCFIFYISQKL